MDGRNSSGRKVSLLNETHEVCRPAAVVLPPLSSRTTSGSSISTPCHSPPQLIRSNTSDTRSMESASPTTPDFTFDRDAQPQKFESPTGARSSLYPIPQSFFSTSNGSVDPYSGPFNPGAFPPLTQEAQTFFDVLPATSNAQFAAALTASPAPPALAAASAPAAPTSSKPTAPKKNQYPCPLAKQFNCNDFFTTSGHAARHAKKHTGKKDAFCPECGKAFTRKDNMEQHRRTHQAGRSATKPTDEPRAKKSKQPQSRKPKPALLDTSMPLQEQPLQISPTAFPQFDDRVFATSSQGAFASPTQASNQDFYQRPSMYPSPTSYVDSRSFVPQMSADNQPEYGRRSSHSSNSSFDLASPSMSMGLDALAIAASGHKRKFDT